MDNNSSVSMAVVGNIFRVLRGRFGSTFLDKFRNGNNFPEGHQYAGKDKGILEAMEIWAHELRGLSNAEIQHGINSKFKHPPSCDEFLHACVQRDYASQVHNASFKALSAPVNKLSREEVERRVKSIKFGVTQDENGMRLNNWIQIAANPKQYPYISRKYAYEVLSKHAPEHLTQPLIDEFTKQEEEIE